MNTDYYERIPATATFYTEENGVRWYIEQKDGTNTVNYMEFEGRVLQGSWAGPRQIFRALVSMSPEERTHDYTHDEYMGVIRQVISNRNERE